MGKLLTQEQIDHFRQRGYAYPFRAFPAEQAAELATMDGVVASHPVMRRDLVLHTPYSARPKDTLFSRQWHLENRNTAFRPKGIDIDARAAWPVAR